MEEDRVDVDVPSETSSKPWTFAGKDIPSSEIVFFSQIIVVYMVIITCIVNLSLHNEPNNLWIALLSSCLGYILPNPAISKRKKLI